MAVDLLPDSRARVTRGSIRSPVGNLIPIFCANCGAHQGNVPEKNITFAFALCQSCVETHGHPAHFRKEPDHVFWQRIEDERKQAEHVTRLEESPLDFMRELHKQLQDPSSPLSQLAKEWQAHVRTKER